MAWSQNTPWHQIMSLLASAAGDADNIVDGCASDSKKSAERIVERIQCAIGIGIGNHLSSVGWEEGAKERGQPPTS